MGQLGIIPPGMFSQAPLFAPTPAATDPILGLALSVRGLGILMGPPLVGSLLERGDGWTYPVFLLSLALAGLILCALALRL
jgi:predicted MFS family arabinose efflux permease